MGILKEKARKETNKGYKSKAGNDIRKVCDRNCHVVNDLILTGREMKMYWVVRV